MENKKGWYTQNPTDSASKREGLNSKYGNYDYGKDARIYYRAELKEVIRRCLNKRPLKKALIAGVNSGEETYYLPNVGEVCGVDLAQGALRKAGKRGIVPILADLEQLPFIDNYFDTCLALRALYSKHTNLRVSLEELCRVLKEGGTVVLSVPNGYVIDGQIKNGMYDYENLCINASLPQKYKKETIELLKQINFIDIKTHELPGEIVIFARKPKNDLLDSEHRI